MFVIIGLNADNKADSLMYRVFDSKDTGYELKSVLI